MPQEPTTDPTAAGAMPAAGSGAAGATPQAPAAPAAGTDGPAGATPAPGATPGAAQPAAATPPASSSGLEAALAAERKRAAAFEKQLKDLQDRDLSETEKLRKQVADQERAITERDQREQETKIRMATVSAAARLGFADPDDAVKLLDRSALAFDEAGAPTNVSDLLGALLKAKPYYASSAARPSGSMDLGTTGKPAYTADDLAKMTPAQIADKWPEIMAATGGKLPRT